MLVLAGIGALRGATPDDARLERVASLYGDQPAGIAVSRQGRVFITFPRHTGAVDFTVGELVSGGLRAFPDQAANLPSASRPGQTLFSVQTVSADDRNRLWMLDTGVLKDGGSPVAGAPKIIVVSLDTNKVVQTIPIPATALVKKSALKDVRIASSIGRRGTAFVTDSAPGAEALIVVDLASGSALRRLQGTARFGGGGAPVPVVEGKPLIVREKGKPPTPFEVGLNAIELSPDQHMLYLGPFTGGRLLTLPAGMAADRGVTDAELGTRLRLVGPKPVAGHFAMDSGGQLYAMDMQADAIERRRSDGGYRTVVRDGRLIWPDTIAITPDDCLYVTASQYNRGARFNDGRDLRRRPFGVFRLGLDGRACPASLRSTSRAPAILSAPGAPSSDRRVP